MSRPAISDSSSADEDTRAELQRQILFLEETVRHLNAELEDKSRELSEMKARQASSDKGALLHLEQGIRLAFRRPKDFVNDLLAPGSVGQKRGERANDSSPARDESGFDAELDRWLATDKIAADEKDGTSPSQTTLLLIGHEASRTGAPKALLELARELKSRRAVRLLFAFPAGGGMLKDFEGLAPCLVLNGRRSGWHKKIRRMAERFAHLPGPKRALANTVMTRGFLEPLRLVGVPAVCWVHDSVRCILEHCEGQKTMGQINAATKQIVYSSPANRAAACHAFRLVEDKTGVARYGMQSPERVERDLWRKQIAARLGLDDHSPWILGCGTIQSRKGVDLFVKAALYVLHLCAKNRPKPHFLWLGAEVDAAYSETVRALQRTDALGANIHFLGEETQPQNYFAACDLFLLTSRDDPYPFVTLEAMAWARPVLAFAGATGQEELFAGCEDLLLPNFSAGEMGEKILDFLRDPAAYEEKGRRAAENAFGLLRWDETADAFANILELETAGAKAEPRTR